MSGGEKYKGRALLERRKAALLTSTREGGTKGQGVDDLREDELKVDTIVRVSEIRTES
jgi:hypothetical protein